VGRGDGAAQDAALVDVLADGIGGEFAVSAARGDDRQLTDKGGLSLQDRRLAADRRESVRSLSRRLDPHLALAVIALTSGLQHGGATEPGQGRTDVGGAV